MVFGIVMYLLPLHFGLCIRGVTTRPCGYARLDQFMFMIHVFNYGYLEMVMDWVVCLHEEYKVGVLAIEKLWRYKFIVEIVLYIVVMI